MPPVEIRMNESTQHDWTERLSAFLDGDLSTEDMAATAAHLEACAGCRRVLLDLQGLVAAAPAYAGRAPERDLWPQIAEAIDRRRQVSLPSRRAARTRRFSLPQLIAASVAFAVLGGGAAWLALRPGNPAPAGALATAPVAGEMTVTPAARAARADSAYDLAVADLQQVLAEGRGRLDTATVRVIEDNLAVIDRALAEARAAIERDPANAFLKNAMAANMRRKLDLLRRASDAIAATEL
jgi:anti-sigma factor RsiW